jgi:hypothetical protein
MVGIGTMTHANIRTFLFGTAVGSASFLVACLGGFLIISQLKDSIRQAWAAQETHQVSTIAKNVPITTDANGIEMVYMPRLP